MLLNLFAQSSRLELKELKSRTQFISLLELLADNIWRECIQDADCIPDHFGYDDIPLTRKEGVDLIFSGLMNYIKDLKCDPNGISFVIYSEYDIQEYGDLSLANRIASFFLQKTNLKYYLTQHTAYDNFGGYSRQLIALKSGNQIKSVEVDRLIDVLFQDQDHTLFGVGELSFNSQGLPTR
jgi:hypothetical protein